MKYICGIFVGFCVGLVACNTGTKLDNKKIAEEMKSRKVLHITPIQLTENTFREGKKTADWLDKRLVSQLERFSDKKNLVEWSSVCNVRSLGVDSLKKQYGISIQRLALRNSPEKLAISKTALQVWDAYRYNAEKKLPMEANVQQEDNIYMLYSQPIALASATCLQCHGAVGKELSRKDFEALRASYPSIDSLTNYTLNEPIGIWNVLFPKNKLAQPLDIK
ncbi:DUF3365 domain-containing protein [Cytophagaceae bacterium DM2B3-1]|uniref:DUF3365 domain-containing protein n=1 Tax=Xanthocytophaga flava TaxID=3048013 RepID=A0ABT7CRU0_9BACT|nr:DUF3365 domain-containing protein [Xanthocytophaga flavus]MDJ1468626.1 DUF3365 domain-containing protein [Xanthocytophaga flavus]MDJ1496406.1 DUF3365 domain-containing protein [Xanthocytophaga flavus]